MASLFFTAPSGSGKTYAITKALHDSRCSFFGVITHKVVDASHNTDVFIAPVTGAPLLGMCKGKPRLVATSVADASHCAEFGATHAKEPYTSVPAGLCEHFAYIFPDVFDSASAFIDEHSLIAMPSAVLLLDELGRLEQDAAQFQRTVLAMLESPQKTIGVIQNASTPFLDKVRQNKSTTVMRFERGDASARDKMYAAAMDFLSSEG